MNGRKEYDIYKFADVGKIITSHEVYFGTRAHTLQGSVKDWKNAI